MKNILMTVIVAAYIQTAWGQGLLKHDSTQVGSNNKTSKVNLRLQYTSDWIYAGRKDSLPAPYLTPSILYAHHSGFFVKGFLSYLTSEKRIDVWGVGGGYRMNKGNLYWGIGGELRLFNDSSYAIQSAVSSMAYSYLAYDLPWLETTFDVNGFFGDTGDILLGLELGKTFFLAENKLSVYPNAYGLWGTQRYYSEYYTYKSTSQRKKQGQGGVEPPPVIAYTVMEEATNFKFLSIDIGIAIKYKFNNFSIHFVPAYAIPFNAATFKTNNLISKENLKNSFYYNVGINFLL
ncbi:MAG: hypothetical protein RLZZ520_190 [Bacteroidota bacterium]|jgi:hypothetical protein